MRKPRRLDPISIQRCTLVVNSIPKAKVKLVLKQLGAETDGNQFMHLTNKTHKISENLPPHGDFNMYFRRDVVKAFGDKHLNYKEDLLRQQVHFFRYYLDRQAIYYIQESLRRRK